MCATGFFFFYWRRLNHHACGSVTEGAVTSCLLSGTKITDPYSTPCPLFLLLPYPAGKPRAHYFCPVQNFYLLVLPAPYLSQFLYPSPCSGVPIERHLFFFGGSTPGSAWFILGSILRSYSWKICRPSGMAGIELRLVTCKVNTVLSLHTQETLTDILCAGHSVNPMESLNHFP